MWRLIMDDIQELPPIVPTPEEFAYNAGWIAYFDKNRDNPHNAATEESLYMSWADGWKSAEIVASSITNI